MVTTKSHSGSTSKQIHFFATANDFLKAVEEFESLIQVKYALTGVWESAQCEMLDSLSKVKNLSVIDSGHDTSAKKTYVVLPKEVSLVTREIPQNSGGSRYAVDQLANPHSFTISPGGTYTTGTEHGLMPGMAGTAQCNSISFELFTAFAKILKRDFTKIRAYYLGPEALKLFEQGVRFPTASTAADRIYDLAKSA